MRFFLIPALLLIGQLIHAQATLEPNGENGKSYWLMSFAMRVWQSEAGLVPTERLVMESGSSAAPQIELEALRNRFFLRMLYQFATPYDATRSFESGFIDGGLKREDLEFALGWTFSRPKRRWTLRPIVGYKRLSVARENLFTQVPDDYNFRYRGPFAGLSQKWVWGYHWSLDLMAAYASFDVDADQVPSPAPFRTYEYDAEGFFLDLSLNIHLSPRVQFMLGYKLQNYPSIQDKVTIVIRDGSGQGVLGSDGLPLTGQVGPPDFDAGGIIAGFHFKFSLRSRRL